MSFISSDNPPFLRISNQTTNPNPSPMRCMVRFGLSGFGTPFKQITAQTLNGRTRRGFESHYLPHTMKTPVIAMGCKQQKASVHAFPKIKDTIMYKSSP